MISQKKPESQIFAFLGLSAGKFDLYKRWFPDFRNAVASGKVSMVSQIEHALMQLSTGGDYQESQIVNVYEPDPDTGQMVLVQKKQRITKKVAQPNIRAIQMYLTNKNPQNWRRSQPDVLTQNNTQAILNVSGDQVKGMLQTFQKQFMIDTKPSAQPVDVEVVDE